MSSEAEPAPFRVRALRRGQYGGGIKEPGEVFDLLPGPLNANGVPRDFASEWMEPVRYDLPRTAVSSDAHRHWIQHGEWPSMPPPPIRVVAIARGFYGGGQREPGDVFEIEEEAHFSPTWMKRSTDPVTPRRAG